MTLDFNKFKAEAEVGEWVNLHKLIHHFCRKHGIHELSRSYQDTSILIQLYNVYYDTNSLHTLPAKVALTCLEDKRFLNVLKDMKNSKIMEA